MKISKQQQRFMGEKWLVARAMEACLWDNLWSSREVVRDILLRCCDLQLICTAGEWMTRPTRIKGRHQSPPADIHPLLIKNDTYRTHSPWALLFLLAAIAGFGLQQQRSIVMFDVHSSHRGGLFGETRNWFGSSWRILLASDWAQMLLS
jgi:hypothetical protein